MPDKKYIIDKPDGYRTWFLWESGKVLSTGDLEMIFKFLQEKEGKE